MEKSCCFTCGTVPAEKLDDLRRELEREIDAALNDGYDIFITRFAEDGDILFARLVNERRSDHPDLYLEVIIPTPERLKAYSRDEWELLSQSDGIKPLCEQCQENYPLSITRYIVEQCGRMIAVLSGNKDDSLFTMDYAKTMGRDIRIINI